jgi:transcriptional regulator with XRE-family HTH domain
VKIQSYLGAALRRLRIEKNLTQEEVAFRADLSVVYLRGIESGRYNPTLNVLFELGKALSVHPIELLKDIPLDAKTWDSKRKRPGPPEGTIRSIE